MKQEQTCKFKTSVGGQALMEGIMMRGPEKIACAVRRPDGTLDLTEEPVKHHAWQKIPFVRGAFAMCESLLIGYRYLMHSAEVSMGDEFEEEEPSKLEQWLTRHFGEKVQNVFMVFAAFTGVLLALLLFGLLPTMIVSGINHFVELGRWPSTILEGLLKVGLFLSYMVAISKMKEIHRVFQYHGAEHKTIACYEAGEELTVENIRKYTRFHPRCGTSFLVLILILRQNAE